MNKFTKVKKALAVSLCASMLSLGASKTKGMNIINFFKNGMGIVESVCSILIGYGLEELMRYSVIMHVDYSRSRTMYKKACYFLRKINNTLSETQRDNTRSKLNLARDLIMNIEHNNDSWFDYLFNTGENANSVRSDKNKAIRSLSEAFPYLNNEDVMKNIIVAKNISNPGGAMEQAFELMKNLPGINFNEADFNQYINQVTLPTAQVVLP